jgi:APA family basic amino acid/polyamine antiporter
VGLASRLLARQPVESDRTSGGPALRRGLGIPGLMCIGLGTMLGGIFATIGVGTLEAGPGVIVSFLLSGLACVFVSLCYAELASMVPIAGSAYTYAYATLGEFVAWIIGWDLILEYGISVAGTRRPICRTSVWCCRTGRRSRTSPCPAPASISRTRKSTCSPSSSCSR